MKARRAQAAGRESGAGDPQRGLKLDVLHASIDRDFDTVFAALTQLRVGALVIAIDAFFISRSEHLAALTIQHAVPAILQYRPFVAAGRLVLPRCMNHDAMMQPRWCRSWLCLRTRLVSE
jgi:hypothetical protein